MPKEPLDLEPYFTIEDLKEARESIGEPLDKDFVIDYSIAPITDMLSLEAPSIGHSAPGTPGADSRGKSKRKLPAVKREVRNLHTGSKQTRKWERLDTLGASDSYREFVRQMEHIVDTLKDSKPHAAPFLKSLKESEAPDYKDFVQTPMDLSTLGRNLDNMLYWTSTNFKKDVELIFSNAKAYYTTGDSSATLNHALELEKIAEGLLADLSESDFTSEHDRLRDLLSQLLPDAHPSTEAATFDEPLNFDPHADAVKRYHFFKEDPSFTQWKQSVKQRIEAEPSESMMDTSDSANESKSSTTVLPDPLFELPKQEFLPPQWHIASSPIYSSLAPELPLVRAPAMRPLANPSSALPACAAQRLLQVLTHRNSVFLQRIKAHTTAHGLSPLDPNVERPIPPPESGNGSASGSNADEPRINLIEPSIRLVMPPPPSSAAGPGQLLAGAASGAALGENGAPIPAGKAPGKLGASQVLKNDPDASVDGEDDEASEAPLPAMPFFSDDNMTQADPIYDDIPVKHDASTLTNSRLSDEGAHEILRQSVGVQLALAGYQGSQDTPLNVLTEVVASFVKRIGFAANTLMSSPGTLEPLPELMNRTISEVFPRGIQSVKSFILSETMKSDNCLRLVDPSTMLGWVEASPTLSPCLVPPATSNAAPKPGVPLKTPQKLAADAVFTQLIREDSLDEKAAKLGETREFFLQQAPFAKRTSSHYAYKPLAYIGSTSNAAVGTPGGLHIVLPADVRPLDAETKAQASAAAQLAASMAHAHLPQGAVPPPQHAAHPPVPIQRVGVMGAPGHHPNMPGLPPQGPVSPMPPNGAPNPQMMPRGYGPGAPSPHMAPGAPGTAPNGPHNVPRTMPLGTAMPPSGAPKKGPVPGTMGYPAAHGPQHGMPPANYASPAGGQPAVRGAYSPHMPPNYAGHPPMNPVPHMPGAVPAGAKKAAIPTAKTTAARAVDPVRLSDEPSPRGTSAKRKRPQNIGVTANGAPEDDETEGEGRRTRSRRAGATGAYGDEYFYEEEFEDGGDDEPKRKKRKTPAKSAKR